MATDFRKNAKIQLDEAKQFVMVQGAKYILSCIAIVTLLTTASTNHAAKALAPLSVSEPSLIKSSAVRKKGYSIFSEGVKLFRESQFEAALSKFKESLSVYRSIKEQGGEGDALLKMGATYEILSKYNEALTSYQQAAEIFKELDERDNYLGALSGTGIIFLRIGKYASAIEQFELALAERADASIPINGLGLTYSYLRQYDKALHFYQKALDIRRKKNQKQGESTTLINRPLA